MTQKNNPAIPSIHSASLSKRMLQGAAIALLLITCFLFNAGTGDPAWGRFWIIRPLVIVPLAGACGGIFYYLMDNIRYRGGKKKVTANILSLIVFIIGIFLGTVLGLDGTMWD